MSLKQTVKIFVASGSDLKEEREKTIVYLNEIGKIHDLLLEPIKWETDIPSGSYDKARIQDEINPLLENSNIAIVMFFSKAGKFTLEEYHLARQKKIKTFLYFKKGFSPPNETEAQNLLELLKFKKEVENENKLLFKEFENLDGLNNLLLTDLGLYFKEEFEPETKPKTQNSNPKTSSLLLTPLPPKQIRLIGREQELKDLKNKLDASPLVVLINGLGGIGKTEVCKTFFYTHYESYHYAAWVDWYGNIKESLVHALGEDSSEFIDAGEKDTIDQRFEKIMTGLRKMKESMLLVLDNLENTETDKHWDALVSLPSCIKILASSREYIEGVDELCLDFLSAEECKALFYRYYKNRDDEFVEKVIALAGNHTLTVELLAKTAHYSGMSISSLYKSLMEKGFNLKEVACGKVSTFWHNDKEKRTFFDHLAKVFDISSVTQGELWVLGNLSVLPSVYIAQESITEWLRLNEAGDLVSLIDKGWIKRDNEYKIYMHPVIAEVVRDKVKPNAQMCGDLIDSMTWKLHKEPGDNPIHKKEFLPYGESVITTLAEENDEDLATLANNASTIFQDIGQLDRALEFQLKAIAIREKVLVPNHSDRAQSYHNLSWIYRDKKDFPAALKYAEKAVAIMQKLFPGGHYLLDLYRENLEALSAGKG